MMRTKRWFGRTWWFVAIALVCATGAGCVYLEVNERELVFRPVREYERTPADQGLAFDELWLSVPREKGVGTERVHAWWLPADRADAPAILYLHGIRWSLGNNLFRIARWHALGFNVLAIDYRGFGKSDGDMPSEKQVYVDARVAWAELKRRVPTTAQRFIYGHSLGAAVALELAATEDGVAGVIAEAGFTSLADIVAERNLPVGPLMSQRFDALARAPQLRAPALFMHGTDDRVVPPGMSERLFAAAPKPKRLLLVEGGSHSNVAGGAMDQYRATVVEFVALAQQNLRLQLAAR